MEHAKVQTGGVYYDIGRVYFPFSFGNPLSIDRDNIMSASSFARDVIGYGWTMRQFLEHLSHDEDERTRMIAEEAIINGEFEPYDLERAGWKVVRQDNTSNISYLGPYDVGFTVMRNTHERRYPVYFTFFLVLMGGKTDPRGRYTDMFVFDSSDSGAIYDPLHCRANVRLYFNDDSHVDFYSRNFADIWSFYPSCDPHELRGEARQWGITMHSLSNLSKYQEPFGAAGSYDAILEEVSDILFERGNR